MQTLFTNGQILDGEGKALAHHAVLVDGPNIARVAPQGEFDGFSGPKADLAGGTLLPGLIDCHVHLCYAGEGNPGRAVEDLTAGEITIRALRHALASLRGGITTVRDCGGVDYLEFAVRDACNAGYFTGPTIRAAGLMICMTGGHGNRFGRIADGEQEVVKAVREQVHAGSDLIKLMATGGVMTPGVNPEDAHYSAEEMAVGIAEGHRFHKPCASHAQGTEGILNAVRGGIDSIEHGIFMNEQCVQEMISRGTYLVPTIAALANILRGADKVPEYVIEKTRRVAEAHRRSLTMFYEAGGRIAMGTDAGTPFNMHGENAQELGLMVEYGLSPMDAIVAATSNAADLNQLSEHGRIKAGAKADLLGVNGDPLADIAAVSDKSNHHFVVKSGALAAGSYA
ncbi:MAG: amidohydrolase family protein [Gammaproteobacteria bacterium]|nr:amidohydrolase family protein [Gammaproteobacteria bacterium]